MAVKKNILLCQKNVFIEIFGRKRGYLAIVEAFSLAKSFPRGIQKGFFVQQTNK